MSTMLPPPPAYCVFPAPRAEAGGGGDAAAAPARAEDPRRRALRVLAAALKREALGPDAASDASDASTAGADDDGTEGLFRAPEIPPAARKRRSVVFAEPLQFDEAWTPPVVLKSAADAARIRGIVRGCVLFSGLEEEALEVVVRAMSPVERSQNVPDH